MLNSSFGIDEMSGPRSASPSPPDGALTAALTRYLPHLAWTLAGWVGVQGTSQASTALGPSRVQWQVPTGRSSLFQSSRM
jgi:hypothetical protein